MTLTELANYDGQDGRRAYIAVNNSIYDVTDSPRWKDGLHPPDHYAGKDLSEELSKAPHVRSVVERFPVVGTLDSEMSTEASSGSGKMIVGVVITVLVVVLIIFLTL